MTVDTNCMVKIEHFLKVIDVRTFESLKPKLKQYNPYETVENVKYCTNPEEVDMPHV